MAPILQDQMAPYNHFAFLVRHWQERLCLNALLGLVRPYKVKWVFPTTTTAGAPFDDHGIADIIIATSDHVDFYILKGILSIASPFFRDMFSLAQPAKKHASAELERVPIAEDSETLDPLLRLCYPVEDPVLSGVTLVEKVLEAAMKYEMVEATKILQASLRGFVDAEPLHVYAAACRLRLENEAALAAAAWKERCGNLSETSSTFTSTMAGGSFVTSMENIPAAAFYRLLRYLRNAAPTSQPATFTSPLPADTQNWEYNPLDDIIIDFEILPGDPDIRLRSTDHSLFPVHSAVLRAADADKLLEGEAGHCEGHEGESRVICVGLNHTMLGALVAFCYPFKFPSLAKSLRHITAVIEAASKYEMKSITETARNQMMSLVDSHPLTIYMIAAEKGWTTEAHTAARTAARMDLCDVYSPAMEEASAATYHCLLEFHHRYRVDVEGLVRGQATPGSAFPPVTLTARQPLVQISQPLLEEALHYGKSLTTTNQYSGCSYCGRNYSRNNILPQAIVQRFFGISGASTILDLSKTLEDKMRDRLHEIAPTPSRPLI